MSLVLLSKMYYCMYYDFYHMIINEAIIFFLILSNKQKNKPSLQEKNFLNRLQTKFVTQDHGHA